jgi:hypothetical protein
MARLSAFRRYAVTTFLWTLLLPQALQAELTAVRPEFEVSTSDSYFYGGYSYPQAHNEGRGSVDIAASANGTFVVVWEDLYAYGPGPYGYSIPGAWFRRIDSLGRPLGPEFRVSGFDSYARGGVAVASDPSGRFVVVWDDYNAESGFSAGTGIMARRYNASGGALGLPFLVNAITTDDQFTPKVALDTAGNFVVVWADFYPDASGYGTIQGRRFDSAGNAQGSQFQVNSTPCHGYPCGYSGFEGFALFDDMDIATNGAGSFMVVWRDSPDTEPTEIRARVFDSVGTPSGSDFVVNTTSDYYGRRGPSVASDGSRFIVGWTDGYLGYNAFARRFDSAGAGLGAEFQVNTSDIYAFTYGPKVAADASGRFVVTWDAQGSGYYKVYGREFDAAGTPVAEPFRVDFEGDLNYDTGGISRHNVAASSAGQFVVVWGQYRYASYTYGVDGRQIGEKPLACTPAPQPGCKQPTIPGRGMFRFRDPTNPRFRSLAWRWARGQEVSALELGDPQTTDSVAFCVYDGSAQTQPLMDLRVPAGGGCTNVPCWQPVGAAGRRFDYFDTARFVGGLEQIRLLAKPEGRGRASVVARKDNLTLPATPLTPPVTVQLQAENGTCWTASYSTRIIKNEGGVFRAKPGSPSAAFLDGPGGALFD